MSKSKMKKSLSILMASTMMVQPIVTMAENEQNGTETTAETGVTVENEGVVADGGDTGNTEEVAAEGAVDNTGELNEEVNKLPDDSAEITVRNVQPLGETPAVNNVKEFTPVNETNCTGFSTIQINDESTRKKSGDIAITLINKPLRNYAEATKAFYDGSVQKVKVRDDEALFRKLCDENIEFYIFGNQGANRSSSGKGRVDYPLDQQLAKKILQESEKWNGKLRPNGSRLKTGTNGTGDPEEFLSTEIYKDAVYEQGIDRVSIEKLSERLKISDRSAADGWKIVAIHPYNLPNGLTYDPDKDTIKGVITTDLENGVYDNKSIVFISNDEKTYVYDLNNYRMGWIGWKDTTPPTIIQEGADANVVNVGDTTDFSIKFHDLSGSFSGENKTAYKKFKYVVALTGIAGKLSNSGEKVNITTLPGTQYDSISGKITGGVTKAGNYRLGVFAKDYDFASHVEPIWDVSGQEAHSYMTVNVLPNVKVLNISTYSRFVKVKVSDGATNLKITMPSYVGMNKDENIINLEYNPTDKDKPWIIMDGHTPGDRVEMENEYLLVPISSDLSSEASVDNITAEAWSNDVTMSLLRESVMLQGPEGGTHKATFDADTGHWMLDSDYATHEEINNDGTKTITKREVWTDMRYNETRKDEHGNIILDENGKDKLFPIDYDFAIYEYTRTYEGENVTNVETNLTHNAIKPFNSAANAGLFVNVNYDSINDKWTSEDGSKVNLIDDPTKYIVETESGFRGEIEKPKNLINSDKASIANSQPSVSAQDINRLLNDSVNLVKDGKVTITDVEDQNAGKTSTITSIKVLKPKSDNAESIDVKNPVLKLEKPGDYTVTVNVRDSNGNIVNAEVNGTQPGKDEGQNTAVNSCTYHIYVPLVKVVYDTDDKTIDLGDKDITDIPIGNTYDTNNDKERPNRILVGERVFELDTDSLPDNKSGVVTKEQVTVTYKYNEVKTGLTVEFVDKDGNILREDDEVLTNQPIGTAYDLTKHSEDHKRIPIGNKIYERVAITPDKLTGTLSLNKDKKPTVIQYVYKEVTPSLTVKYRDLEGNEIKPDKLVLDKQHAGTSYDVSTEEYRPVKITVDDGKVYELQANETLVNGKKSDKLSGNLGGDDIDVTFKYKEVKTSLTVKFVDENGKEIKAEVPVHKDVSVGTKYNVEGIENEPITTPDGKVYVIESVPDDMKGKLTEDAKTITLRYKEVKSAVVVNYVDEAGDKLVDAKIVMKDQSIGTHYDASTKEFKLPKITLSNGKVYKIVPKKTKGQLTGKVTKDKIDITFVYEEVKTDLVVKYVDESGNEIKLPVTVLKDVSCGTAYNVDTASLKPVKIVVDGKEYELVVEKTIGKMSGKLVDGGNEVRFVYRLVKKPGILPVIKHEEVKPNVPRTGDMIIGNSVIVWFMSVVSGLFGYKKLKDDEE